MSSAEMDTTKQTEHVSAVADAQGTSPPTTTTAAATLTPEADKAANTNASPSAPSPTQPKPILAPPADKASYRRAGRDLIHKAHKAEQDTRTFKARIEENLSKLGAVQAWVEKTNAELDASTSPSASIHALITAYEIQEVKMQTTLAAGRLAVEKVRARDRALSAACREFGVARPWVWKDAVAGMAVAWYVVERLFAQMRRDRVELREASGVEERR